MADNRPRFQSSLGTANVNRVYKEGYNIDRVTLGTVTEVHYRYNTVDVAVNGSSISKGGTAEGKFSAKLPVSMGGRTADGKPFGEINPIEVGTLVLVGFVDGSKTTPIVLGIYGRPDEDHELSRAPFASGDTSNEEVAQLANQQFKVYPSLTYENVDGKGNRTVSFTGKSFMVTDADASPMGSPITDDGEGTQYEDLESSYYYSGELIEPKEGKAPVILFKHQGDRATTSEEDGYQEEDPHSLMFFIDQDGTYRTSMVNDNEDWRTYFEMTPDGSLKFRAQNDSKAVGMGEDYNEFTIGHDGIGFRVGDRYLQITPDGNFGDLGLGGGISDGQFNELRDGIDRVLEANLSIEQTNEELRVIADKLVEESDALVDYQSQFLITAEEIASTLSETRIYDIIEEGLDGYSDTITQVAEDAVNSMEVIQSLSDDGILSPIEKQGLYIEWDMIKAEYPSYLHQAEKEGVSANPYTQAYNSLKAYIEPLLEDLETAHTINRRDFNIYFSNYFTARTNLVNRVYDSLKFEIMEAAEEAADAGTTANQALGTSSLAISESNRDLGTLLELLEDDVVQASEKEDFEEIYERAQEHFTNTLDQAQKYLIGSDAMQSRYQDLVTVVETTYGILDNMNGDTDVGGRTIYNAFSDLYQEIQEVLSVITSDALEKLLSFEGDLEHFETDIQQTSREIKLIAESVELIGREVSLSQAYISVQSDKIDQRVTKVEFHRDLGDAQNPIYSAGKNLFVKATSQRGRLNANDGRVVSGDGLVSNFIKAKPFRLYTVTVFDNPGSNTINVAFYSDDLQYISGDSISGSEETLKLLVTTPRDTAYIRVGVDVEANIQVESGTGSSYYFLANEDVGDSVLQATENMNNRKEYFLDLDNHLKTAQAKGAEFLSILERLMEDNLITVADKSILKQELEKLEEERPEILDVASAQDVESTVYTNAYNQLEIYLNSNFLDDMDSETMVVPNTMRTIFQRFYDARENLLGTLTSNARASYEASLDLLDDVSQNVTESEERARQLAEQAEAAARNVAYLEESIAEANEVENRDMEIVGRVSGDGLLDYNDILEVVPIAEEMEMEKDWLVSQANAQSVGTANYENALRQLLQYFNQFTTPEALREVHEVNAQTFTTYFEEYHRAKSILLEDVLAGAKGEYEKIDVIAHAMRNEAKRRAEQMQSYINAVKDSELAITRLEEKIEEIENNITYAVQIVSTNGLSFKNRIINTTLEARLIKGSDDITSTIKPEDFVWSKVNADGTEDKDWNELHVGAGNRIHITHEDVDSRATFNVKIYEEVEDG